MTARQFLILPPYQGSGHGCKPTEGIHECESSEAYFPATFYNLVYLYLLQRPDIAELTIEDPSEAFQDMRDKVDFQTLVSADAFKGIVAPVDPIWREATRKEWKLGTRQFYRLLEMKLRKDMLEATQIQKQKSKAGAAAAAAKEKKYRLMVKERLCRFNYEILAPMEKKERRETLQQTYDSVVDEYDRLLDQIGE